MLLVGSALAGRGDVREAPEGFQVMEVHAVVPIPGGAVVLLADPDKQRLLQIGVGESEGLTIALRHDRETFKRPLTHDLLDEMLLRAGARVVEVRVDDVINDTFVAKVTMAVKRKEHVVEARASDSIALALGHGLPLYVAEAVLDRAAISADELAPDALPDDPRRAL